MADEGLAASLAATTVGGLPWARPPAPEPVYDPMTGALLSPQYGAPTATPSTQGMTLPEQYARQKLSQLGDILTGPGRVMSGELPMQAVDPNTGEVHTSPQAMDLASGLASLSMTGGVAGTGAGGVALGAGPVSRAAANKMANMAESPPTTRDVMAEAGTALGSRASNIGSLLKQLITPQPRDAQSPVEYRTASPLVNITRQDIEDATANAMAFSGGGLGIKADPKLSHGISDIKLPRPLEEMPRERLVTNPQPPKEKLISPEDLQGSILMPVMGDRAAAGGAVSKVGETALETPVELHGGHGYMSEAPQGQIWASEKGPTSALARRVREISEATGKPVELVYSAMGPQGTDFSHHTGDVLSQLVRGAPIPKEAAAAFDARMRTATGSYDAVANWPGIQHPDLMQYLRDAPGKVTAKMAQMMDKRREQGAGFPSVAEVRHAIMDPRLLNVNLGDAGLSIARPNPAGIVQPSTHPTYATGIEGTYTGGLGMSLPPEVLFPDMVKTYAKESPGSRFDYLASRGTAPYHQVANQQWLDTVMPHWLRGSAQR